MTMNYFQESQAFYYSMTDLSETILHTCQNKFIIQADRCNRCNRMVENYPFYTSGPMQPDGGKLSVLLTFAYAKENWAILFCKKYSQSLPLDMWIKKNI